MCGINGFITKDNLNKEQLNQQINAMNNLIIHRGPDADGTFAEQGETFNLAMGMRRLSIIDLSSGDQPMYSLDNDIVIVFNGEIYNFLELKKELVDVGVQFKTTSDTEVILKLYETYGVESFKMLDGMYAFSIYDKKKNKVYVVRDYFGEKPLYYTHYNGTFVWGSELKSIIKRIGTKPAICKTGLNLFLRLTYIPAPYSIYSDIHKLESNQYIEIDPTTLSFSLHQVTTETVNDKKEDVSFKEAKAKVKQLVYDSVDSRSISDVPLGTFLSGGVDSSIVSLCLANSKSTPIDTFSIGFEKKSYDETDKSQTVAKLIKSNHHEFIIGEKDLEGDVHNILMNFDEPFADSSSLPTYLVSNRTREYVKVALTGDGGDEMFGGYNKYYAGRMNMNYTKFIPRTLHQIIQKSAKPFLRTTSDNRGTKFKVQRLLNSIDYNNGFYWDIISLGFTQNTINKYLSSKYQDFSVFKHYKTASKITSPTTLTDFRLIDKNVSLEGDMLVKVDRTSMLNSLECRAPFLNKKIWDYANILPETYLMKGWNKKRILKEAFREEFPEDFLEKGKQGFGVPVGDWLRSSLKEELIGYSELEKLNKQGIFNTDEIARLVKNHTEGIEDSTFKVWTYYCFQKWYYNTYEKI